MTTPYKRITKKIDNSYLVWFEESNQWVYLEEPAYFVFRLYQDNLSKNAIFLKTSKKYNLEKEAAKNFVNEIIEGLDKLSVNGEVADEHYDILNLSEKKSIHHHYSHTYNINHKVIKIWYETPLQGYYIHTVFQHLEVNPGEKKSTIEFEIFNYEQNYTLRLRNQPGKCRSFEEIGRLRRQLYIEISNVIYDKEEKDWMSFLHASAVSNGIQTILFSSASGSGKSTLAALLYEKGFQIVSDDFVPLDSALKRAFPFPAAISIKEKAFAMFPHEKFTELRYQELNNKSVKFLNPGISGKDWYKAYKVKKIIFINYNPLVKFKFSLVPLPEALRLFYEQAFMSASYENARRFINWFAKMERYKLEYSDNEQAIKQIMELFKKK